MFKGIWSIVKAKLARSVLLIMGHTLFAVISAGCLLTVGLLILGGLFAPSQKYRVVGTEALQNRSSEFLGMLEALTDAKSTSNSKFEVLTNGNQFYSAELEAIRAAGTSVNFQAYIFDRGEIGQKYVEAFAERARAGIQVHIVCDAIGSRGANRTFFDPVVQAGGKIAWYNRPRWYRIAQIDNRNHRELMVIDGRVGFIGGAGVADWWYETRGSDCRWRDTVVRVEGDTVNHLQSTFAATWLETFGEIMASSSSFPKSGLPENDTAALVVCSTPSDGGCIRVRMLFLTLLASATKSIHINTPYFLPDKHISDAIARAVKDRAIEVTIVVPSKKSDHVLTRSASRRLYGPMLKAGARIYEYQPSMIHAKVMLIDELWSIVGSTNLDHRSFGINDEVNLAVRGAALNARLQQDFDRDVGQSRELSFDEWRRRPFPERIVEFFGWFIQQQQ